MTIAEEHGKVVCAKCGKVLLRCHCEEHTDLIRKQVASCSFCPDAKRVVPRPIKDILSIEEK